MRFHVKTDRSVLGLYAIVIICGTLGLLKGALRWDQIQYAVVALVLPSIFGVRPDSEKGKPDA